MTDNKRLTLKELKQKVVCLKEYYQLSDNAEILLRINEGKEYIVIDDNGFEEIINVLMRDKRYFKREWDERYYIFDSNIISEKEFDDRVQYEGYKVFADSMTQNEVLELLNENERLKCQISEDFNQSTCITVQKSVIADLRERNNRQAEQLDRLYCLIEAKDWRALTDILDDFKECEEQLLSEWRQY